MQPEIQTDFQMITNQPGNTAIGSKGGSLKGNTEIKSEDKCFLGMLTDVEKMPKENMMEFEKLQEKSQNDESLPGMVIKTEQEICSLIGDMVLKGEKISEILLGPEQNNNGSEEKQLIPMTSGKGLLIKGDINGNEIDKNSSAAALKAETESVVKNSATSEKLNISVKTGKNESNRWQEELNKNNTGSQISKESNKNVGNVARAQLLNRLEADIAKLITGTETIGKSADAQIKPVDAKAQLLTMLETDIAKMIKDSDTAGKSVDAQIKHADPKGQLFNGLEANIAKILKDSDTIIGRENGQIKHVANLKDVKKAAAKDGVMLESATFRTDVEESKIFNRTHLFNEEIKDSGLSKKDLLVKLSTGIQEKEQESDLLNRDNTSDKKSSQADKEFINLKEGGLKLKASGSEFSAGKMIGMEAESKDNGIMLPKNVSGDKSSEEIMFARENRLSSNISRDGTLNQIVEKATLILKNGKSQARLELKPEFLGSVRMKITTENHLVTVRILTELPVVKEMIENNISQLKTDLQNHGLAIDKLDVSVANDSPQHGKGFEKSDILLEKENNDVSDNGAVVPEETGTVNLLKEDSADDRLDFFA